MSNLLDALLDKFSTTISFQGSIFNLEIGDWLVKLVIAVLIVVDLRNFAKWYRREGIGGGIDYLVTVVFMQAIAIIIFWYGPQWTSYLLPILSAELLRWLLLFALSVGVYFGTRKHGGRRGLATYLVHLGIFLLGWLLGKWAGIILVSIPLLVALYFTLYHLAIAIIPSADPDSLFLNLGQVRGIFTELISLLYRDSRSEPQAHGQKSIRELLSELASAIGKMGGEKYQRFMILFWYLWGFQYPQMAIADTIGRQIETRIPGSPFKKLGAPGMIWCKSSQVVGLTDGPNFARVGGPGPVFTKHFERPVQISDLSRSASEAELVGCVDLRMQFRSTVFNAVSKDGHTFEAVLFIAFSIDSQKEWSRAEYHRLRKANPILEGGRICDKGTEAYSYNQARVQAALSRTAIDDSTAASRVKAIHWDEWVLSQMCEAAQQVLCQRNLDELWRPRANGPGKNALDEIGNELKALMAPRLQEFGIQLGGARVVNYILPQDHPVVKQQIATWSASWENRAQEMLAEGQAEADRLELEARAYARYMFLTMVAEGLEKAKQVHRDLPKRVVAMRIIAAMEDLLRQRPGTASEEPAEHVAAIRQRMLPRS
jgi:hypothetical protein